MYHQIKTPPVAMWLPVFVLLTLLGAPAKVRPEATTEPLAKVDGAAITSEDVEKAIGAPWIKLQEQIYNLKRQKLEALISEKLLAQEADRRRISLPTLLDVEVTSKVGLVTEQEIENYYQANIARFQGDEAEARQQIRSELQGQKLAARRQAFLDSLRSQAKIVVNLKAAPVARVEIGVNGAIATGPATAPVTIVEFEDFHCPFCKRVQSTIAEIKSRYGDKVRLVHRDLPLDRLHPQARQAHEAARCANDQGKFWAYQDLLYANSPVSPADLKTYARQAGIDLAAFDKCVSSKTYKTMVQNDVDDAGRLGVSSTPTFFINGRQLVGAQPFERFVQIIEDELMRSGSN